MSNRPGRVCLISGHLQRQRLLKPDHSGHDSTNRHRPHRMQLHRPEIVQAVVQDSAARTCGRGSAVAAVPDATSDVGGEENGLGFGRR